VGGTNVKFGDSIWEDEETFDSGTDFAIGGGIKATFLEAGGLKLGGLLQANWSEFDGKLTAAHWAASDFVEIDIAEVQIAAGASYTWAERVSIYGGPFLHFISGDLHDTFSEAYTGSGDPSLILTSEYSWDIDEKWILGAYIGVQVELSDRGAFNIEAQHTAEADAIGLSLTLKF
jgi:long-subunit fatty acid transport protein